MKILISCSVQGETFRPTEAERSSESRFSEKNEVGEIDRVGRYRSKPQPYGYGVLRAEIDGNDLEMPFKRFLDQVQQILPVWRNHGAETINLQMDVFYRQQCNLEFSESLIATLHALGLPLAFSCYRESNAEIP